MLRIKKHGFPLAKLYHSGANFSSDPPIESMGGIHCPPLSGIMAQQYRASTKGEQGIMEPQRTDGQAAVDFTRIQETSDGDTEFERELLGVFIEDCEDRIQRLSAAIAAGRLDEIKREAHTIKGAAANVGTTRLQEIAEQLEALHDGSISEGQALAGQLTEEFERVKAAIGEYIETI
jgi:HPt (histidine-containing phosphotransfer) domain-containing protein